MQNTRASVITVSTSMHYQQKSHILYYDSLNSLKEYINNTLAIFFYTSVLFIIIGKYSHLQSVINVLLPGIEHIFKADFPDPNKISNHHDISILKERKKFISCVVFFSFAESLKASFCTGYPND